MKLPKKIRLSTVVAAILLAVHTGLLLGSIRHTFITVDELGHMAAGLSYWETGRFSVYRVNPPLSKMLAVIPVMAADPVLDFGEIRDEPGVRAEWVIGPRFASTNQARLFDLICLARLMGLGWSALGGLLIFVWSRSLYGGVAGCLALALWCFEPNILGHAPLVTSDVPAAVMGLAATYAFVGFLRAPTWHRSTCAGVVLGLAVLTKFTLILFYFLWPTLWLACAVSLRRSGSSGRTPGLPLISTRTPSLRVQLAQNALILVISILVINLGYAFDGTLKPLGEYGFSSRAFTGLPDSGRPGVWEGPGNRFRGTGLGSLPVPLPADVLLGIDVQRRDFESRWRSFLAGEWRRQGWWYYYLYALGLKLPIGTIALMLVGLAATVATRRTDGRRVDEVVLVATSVALLAFVSSQTGFSHHMRYALTALPYLMVLAGRLAEWWTSRARLRGVAIAGLLAWSIISSLSTYPHSLSYFNEIAGGPENGHEYLLDSNIDWGQDLLDLKRWLDANPEAQPLGLAYFNIVDPKILGIDFTLPPPSSQHGSTTVSAEEVGPHPGYFAVSVNFLHGMEFSVADGTGDFKGVAIDDFAYFRRFNPIAKAGYSIYIYHITLEQAEAARREMGLPPLPRPST
jgi:hypothetical protein